MADSNVFKVSDFGAFGTATANSHTAIQAACDAAIASRSTDGYCTVLFDVPVIRNDSVVNVTGSICLKSNGLTQIYGSGNVCFSGTHNQFTRVEGLAFGSTSGSQSANGFSTALLIATSNDDPAMMQFERVHCRQNVGTGIDQSSYAGSRSTTTEINHCLFECSSRAFLVYSDMLTVLNSRFTYQGQAHEVMVIDSMSTLQDCMFILGTAANAAGSWIKFKASDFLRQLHLRNGRFSDNGGMLIIDNDATPNVDLGAGSDAQQTGATFIGGYYETAGSPSGRRTMMLVHDQKAPNFFVAMALGASYQEDGFVKMAGGGALPAKSAGQADPYTYELDKTARNVQMLGNPPVFIDPIITGRSRVA